MDIRAGIVQKKITALADKADDCIIWGAVQYKAGLFIFACCGYCGQAVDVL